MNIRISIRQELNNNRNSNSNSKGHSIIVVEEAEVVEIEIIEEQATVAATLIIKTTYLLNYLFHYMFPIYQNKSDELIFCLFH